MDSSLSDSDVINAVITTTATPSLIANVETLNVDFKGFGVTLAAAGVTYGATGGATINAKTTQVGNEAATITGLSIGNLNVAVDSSIKTLTLTGTANANDATKLTLAGGSLALTNTAATGVETVTFNSKGAANTVTITGTGTTGVSYIASGDQDLTLKGATGSFNNVQVAKSSGFSKALNVEITAAGAGSYSNIAADKIVFSTAGIGANTVNFANKANVSLNVATAASGTTMQLVQPTSALGVASTGTLNTLNLSVDKASGLTSGAANSGVTFDTKVATLNLTANVAIGSSTGSGTASYLIFNDQGAGTGQTTTLNLLGSSDVNIYASGKGGDATDRLVINGTSYSGSALTVTADASGATGLVTVLGSNSADRITIASGASTIVGGSGNDTITGGAAADSITGDAGNDTIVFSAGADTVTGGAGSDTFRIGAGSTGTTVTDFLLGTDKITLTGTGTVLDATSVTITSGYFNSGGGHAVLLQTDGTNVVANVNSGVGDDWSTSLVFGTSTTAYSAATGTSAIKLGSSADNLSLANGGASGAGDRTVALGSGDDTITLTGANAGGTNNGVTISGGAGNDTIAASILAGSGGVAVVKFEATASANGTDTITGFATSGATGVDKLDFSAFLGSTGLGVYTSSGTSGTAQSSSGTGTIDLSTAGSGGSGNGATGANEVFVIFTGTSDLTSSYIDTTTTAVSRKINIEDGSKSVVILADGSRIATSAKVYFVTNGPVTGSSDLSIELVGTIGLNSGTMNDFIAASIV